MMPCTDSQVTVKLARGRVSTKYQRGHGESHPFVIVHKATLLADDFAVLPIQRFGCIVKTNTHILGRAIKKMLCWSTIRTRAMVKRTPPTKQAHVSLKANSIFGQRIGGRWCSQKKEKKKPLSYSVMEEG